MLVLNKPIQLLSLLMFGLTLLPAGLAQADPLIDALQNGSVKANMRLRYEAVDDYTNKYAKALTLRTRLTYTSGDLSDFTLLLEAEDSRDVFGVDEYAPVQSGFATIGDKPATEVNQAFLRYSGVPGLSVTAGRQRIIFDNARFVGNVGWRQNEQTFEGVRAEYKWNDLKANYAYLTKVHTISGTDNDVTDHLINLNYSPYAWLKVGAYGYFLKADPTDKQDDTLGLSIKGKVAVSDAVKVLYAAEYAFQTVETIGATGDDDAKYTALSLGGQVAGVTAKVGVETLGSDKGNYGFQTSLATKHAFNGWADKFLSTPANGLEDKYLDITVKMFKMKFKAVYHDYSADHGSDDYGSEVNLLAVKPLGKHYKVGIKYADFSSDSNTLADTTKTWLWGNMTF